MCPALELSAVDRVVTKFLFDAEELVVFGDPVGAAEGTSLDLAGIRGDGDVRDRGVLGLARAMADDGRVFVFLGEFDGVERLSERADLVDLHEDRIGHALIDTLLEEFDICDKQIVADELALRADLVGEQLPALQVVLGAAVLDRNDRIFCDKLFVVIHKLVVGAFGTV